MTSNVLSGGSGWGAGPILIDYFKKCWKEFLEKMKTKFGRH